MMGIRIFARRVAKDESGYIGAQYALLLALASAIAGFGMLLLADSIADNMKAAADKFAISDQ